MTVNQLLEVVPLLTESVKTSVAPKGAVARTIMHIYLGLGIYLAIAALRRGGLRSHIGIAAVAILAAASETMDYVFAAGAARPHWLLIDSIGDFLHTLVLPSVLYLGAGLWNGRSPPRKAGPRQLGTRQARPK